MKDRTNNSDQSIQDDSGYINSKDFPYLFPQESPQEIESLKRGPKSQSRTEKSRLHLTNTSDIDDIFKDLVPESDTAISEARKILLERDIELNWEKVREKEEENSSSIKSFLELEMMEPKTELNPQNVNPIPSAKSHRFMKNLEELHKALESARRHVCEREETVAYLKKMVQKKDLQLRQVATEKEDLRERSLSYVQKLLIEKEKILAEFKVILQQREEEIASVRRKMEEKSKSLEESMDLLMKKDTEIMEIRKNISEKEKSLSEAVELLMTKDGEISSIRRQMEEKEKKIEEIQANLDTALKELREKQNSPELRVIMEKAKNGGFIKELLSQIQEKQTALTEAQNVIAKQAKALKILLNIKNQYQDKEKEVEALKSQIQEQTEKDLCLQKVQEELREISEKLQVEKRARWRAEQDCNDLQIRLQEMEEKLQEAQRLPQQNQGKHKGKQKEKNQETQKTSLLDWGLKPLWGG